MVLERLEVTPALGETARASLGGPGQINYFDLDRVVRVLPAKNVILMQIAVLQSLCLKIPKSRCDLDYEFFNKKRSQRLLCLDEFTKGWKADERINEKRHLACHTLNISESCARDVSWQYQCLGIVD